MARIALGESADQARPSQENAPAASAESGRGMCEAPLGDLIGSADGMVLPLPAQTEQPCERIDSGLDG